MTTPSPCATCSAPATAACAKCRATRYCSRECLETDHAVHKLLCTAAPLHRPSEHLRRVLFFHPQGRRPEWLWRESVSSGDQNEQQPDMKHLFDEAVAPVSEVLTAHPFTSAPLRDRRIHVRMADADATRRSPAANTAVAAAVPAHHEGVAAWTGPLLAYACEVQGGAVRDMSLADYSCVVAFLVDRGNARPSHVGRKGPKVGGVKVLCEGSEGRRLQGVRVPRFHPQIADPGVWAERSGVSEAIGVPLVFSKVPISKRQKEGGVDTTNEVVSTMLISLDPAEQHDHGRGLQGFGYAPAYWDADVGDVLIYRDSLGELEVEVVEAFAVFCVRVAFRLRGVEGGEKERKARVGEVVTRGAWEEFLREWGEDRGGLVRRVDEETEGEVEGIVAGLRGE